MVLPGQRIVVWFSCGAASAVAAKKTIEQYGASNHIDVVYNPVAEEDPDNLRFLSDVETWLGRFVEVFKNPKWPAASAKDVWAKRRFMASPTGAPCTVELKKEARYVWEHANRPDWHVLGFTADEKARHQRFILTERSNVLPVLIDAGLAKAQCVATLTEAGIAPPRVYALGYPNANCIGCVKVTSPTYWNLVRRTHPAVFADRAVQSREIGARLVRVRGERKFLDELLPTDKGRSLKHMNVDCGIFCEEKP